MSRFEPWSTAMARALYGPDGFYTQHAPAEHFATATGSPAFADGIARLAQIVADALRNPPGFTVVDLGAGRGELLTALSARLAESVRLVGVEVPGRTPLPDLPPRVEWCDEIPSDVVGLIVANEWLDNIPVDVVEADEHGALRLVRVDEVGVERLGPELASGDDRRSWLERWWPRDVPHGTRAEVGLARDAALAFVAQSLDAGLVVAIDYGHVATDRPLRGTLAGFRAGRAVRPVPDGSMDVTAHVAIDACAAAAATTGAAVSVRRQRDVLHALGVDGRLPTFTVGRGHQGPAAYVRALARAGDAALVTDPRGLGAFYWLACGRGIALPTAVDERLDAVEDPL